MKEMKGTLPPTNGRAEGMSGGYTKNFLLKI